jgi:hypothetical protein
MDEIEMFVAASDALPSITDDDCRVIVQDWNGSDPDQRVAIRLAAEVLRLREVLKDVVPRSRWEAAERDLVATKDEMTNRGKRAVEVVTALLAAVNKSADALRSGQIGHINGDMAVYHLEGHLCGSALDACRNALAVVNKVPA